MGVAPFDLTSDEVLKMIRSKANSLAGNFGFSRSDADDIRQELALHLHERAPKLAARTASQKTVLDRALRNKISNMIDTQIAAKRDRRRDLGLETAPATAFLDGDGSDDEFIDHLDMVDAIRSMPRELQDVAERLKQSNPAEVMRELGITRGQLRQRIEKIRRHFLIFGIHPNNQLKSDSGQ